MADYSYGLPVEIGSIDRELKKLWQQDQGANTRASLINFAIYCEGRERMQRNTELIAEFTRNHACRALLIALDAQATERKSQAWISAHCHMSRAGAKQVCCEQITFLLEGDSKSLIPNIVFSHLDSDLPLYLWWQGGCCDTTEAQLWTWVDRLIIDSQSWTDPAAQFQTLRHSLAAIKPRLILCDLNWTRLLYWRQAMARTFEHPENREHLGRIESVEISHAPGFRTTAALLAGWLIAQMGWKMDRAEQQTLHLFSESTPVDIFFHELSGPSINKVVLKSSDAEFAFRRQSDGDYLHTDVFTHLGRENHHLLPAAPENLLELLNQELMSGGHHEVYLKALTAAQSLL